MFPSPTAGTGRLLKQYRKSADGQGGGLTKRRVSCAQCGFPGCDLNRHDSSGGSLSGDGAGGAITLQSFGSGTQQDGDGSQTYNRGGGCSLCFSKNYASRGARFDEFMAAPFYTDRLF